MLNGRPVGQQAGGGGNGDFAQGQRLPVQGQLGDAPVVGAQMAAGLPDQGFEIAVLLLEVLGAQEHSLRTTQPYCTSSWRSRSLYRFIESGGRRSKS